jgi:hypothetical protein
MAVGRWLTVDARTQLLAVALLAAGGAALLPQGRPALPRRAAASATLLVTLALTDRAAFITFALASGSAAPVLTAAGAAIGSIAAVTLALSDPAIGRRLPTIGRVAGSVLLLAGTVLALRALRLI